MKWLGAFACFPCLHVFKLEKLGLDPFSLCITWLSKWKLKNHQGMVQTI